MMIPTRNEKCWRERIAARCLEAVVFFRVPWKNSGKKMCPCYHSKKYCFDNFRNRESHIPQSQVLAKEDKNYVQEILEESQVH